MKDRTAIDTIKGYYYQFDYFILKLLECINDTDYVCVEGIEDVDIKTYTESTAIQCKYYEKTEYNDSVIAKPLRFMFEHFLEKPKACLKYKLYGHYESGQDKLPNQVDIDFFKNNFLKLKQFEGFTCNDQQIIDFLRVLEVSNNAPKFTEQEDNIYQKIIAQFNCGDIEAEHYYNNALSVVRKLSIKSDINKRQITKGDFLTKIDNKDTLFNLWYIKKKGIKNYCSLLRKQYFTHTNISPFERFFLIECDNIVSNTEIKTLLQNISKTWSKLSQREKTPFCPYVYLHNIDESRLIEILKLLQADDFVFIDGYDFKGADFSVKSITNEVNHHNGIKLKIIRELDLINPILTTVAKTREIYQFVINDLFYTNKKHTHIKIKIEEAKNITDII